MEEQDSLELRNSQENNLEDQEFEPPLESESNLIPVPAEQNFGELAPLQEISNESLQKQPTTQSIDTNQLTDLYAKSPGKEEEVHEEFNEEEQNEMLNEDDVRSEHDQEALNNDLLKSVVIESSLQQPQPESIESLSDLIKQKNEIIAQISIDNMEQADKIRELMAIIEKQNREILQLKQTSVKRNQVLKSQGSQSQQQRRGENVGGGDEDFYKTKDKENFQKNKEIPTPPKMRVVIQPGGVNTDKMKKKMKIEEVKQGLWVQKDSDHEKKQERFRGGSVKEQKEELIEVKAEKVKRQAPPISITKRNLASKKKLNDDLAMVESGVKQRHANSLTPGGVKEEVNEEEYQEKYNLPQVEAVGAAKMYSQLQEKVNRHNYNRLEALKFKMSLQLRNLRLLKDHDSLMRGVEKKYVGGQRRENKIQNIQQITRLERDIERTSKQLQQEIHSIQVKMQSAVDLTEQENAFVQESQALFQEAEEYFMRKEQDKMDNKAKKDYTKVNSRINTNLNAPKGGIPRFMRGQGEHEEDAYHEENQEENINHLIEKDQQSPKALPRRAPEQAIIDESSNSYGEPIITQGAKLSKRPPHQSNKQAAVRTSQQKKAQELERVKKIIRRPQQQDYANDEEDEGERHFEGNGREIEEETVNDRNQRRKSSSLHSKRGLKLPDINNGSRKQYSQYKIMQAWRIIQQYKIIDLPSNKIYQNLRKYILRLISLISQPNINNQRYLEIGTPLGPNEFCFCATISGPCSSIEKSLILYLYLYINPTVPTENHAQWESGQDVLKIIGVINFAILKPISYLEDYSYLPSTSSPQLSTYLIQSTSSYVSTLISTFFLTILGFSLLCMPCL